MVALDHRLVGEYDARLAKQVQFLTGRFAYHAHADSFEARWHKLRDIAPSFRAPLAAPEALLKRRRELGDCLEELMPTAPDRR